MDKLLATPTWGASSSSATEAGGEMFMGFATMGTDLAKVRLGVAGLHWATTLVEVAKLHEIACC